MLELVIGSRIRKLILIYMAAREGGYTREIAKFYNIGLSPVQNQLAHLENGNVLSVIFPEKPESIHSIPAIRF